MEHYERFTKRDDKGNVYYPHCFEKCGGFTDTERCINCDYYDSLLNKFADLEELESKGLLLSLPCKVGDTVYVLVEMNESGKYTRIKADFIESIYQNPDGEWMISFRYIWHDTELFDIGQTVFLTKEEAEQKLESMKGE